MSKCALLDHNLLKVLHHDCIILGKLNFMCCFVGLLVLFCFLKTHQHNLLFFPPNFRSLLRERRQSFTRGIAVLLIPKCLQQIHFILLCSGEVQVLLKI